MQHDRVTGRDEYDDKRSIVLLQPSLLLVLLLPTLVLAPVVGPARELAPATS